MRNGLRPLLFGLIILLIQGTGYGFSLRECGDAILFQIEYEQLDNKEVKECLVKLENHQELVYIT